MLQVRNAVHHDFERNGDLLLHLFGRNAGPLGDDLDVVVGDVGIGLHRKAAEGNDAPDEEQQGDGEHQEAVCRAKSTALRIISAPGDAA